MKSMPKEQIIAIWLIGKTCNRELVTHEEALRLRDEIAL